MFANAGKQVMKEENHISVSMTLSGRVFPVKVTPEEEPFVREIETELNNKINMFKKDFPSRDLADHVLMTLLTVVYENLSKETEKDVLLTEKIAKLRHILS
jgi:cell division protein ZapA (FtsZ GTPase activity inhibitor)